MDLRRTRDRPAPRPVSGTTLGSDRMTTGLTSLSAMILLLGMRERRGLALVLPPES